MGQGITTYRIKRLEDAIAAMTNGEIKFGDSPSIDSFSRARVSQPQGLFDCQLTYNLQPLVFEQLTAESGAAIAHNATNRSATMTFADTPTGGYAYMQSYEYIRYQPGKSQLAFVTFNFKEAVASVVKFAGYSDGSNGVEFRLDGTTKYVSIFSDSSLGDESVSQSNWNLDTLDGNGDSEITLDITKTQILVIDLQALYAGRVRVGFDIDGSIIYVHEFLHANKSAHPYIQSASLPIRCGMSCTGTVSTTMEFICSSVISEGGQDDTHGFGFSATGTATAGNDTRVHILSVRPKTTFNSITNRTQFQIESIELIVTGNAPIKWELCIGQAISGTTAFNDVNATYSAFEYNTLGTISGSPAMVLAAGYVVSAAQTKGSVAHNIAVKAPITLSAAGAARILGTMSVIVTGLGATSACRCIMNWKEIR